MSKRILVVDDDPVIRILITEYLGLHGHLVDSAESGGGCFEKLKGDLPDLIVLDLMMPDMTGFDVLKRLKNDDRTASLPVIMLSANGNTETIAKGYEVHADRYVDKPFEIRTILEAIKGLENEGLLPR